MSRMAVVTPPSGASKVLLTCSNSTISSSGMTLVRVLAIRKQTVLDPSQKAVDSIRQAADDNQYENNVFRQPPPLAGRQQIAQPVLRINQFREHDVAEGQPEQRPQAFINVRQGQRH